MTERRRLERPWMVEVTAPQPSSYARQPAGHKRAMRSSDENNQDISSLVRKVDMRVRRMFKARTLPTG